MKSQIHASKRLAAYLFVFAVALTGTAPALAQDADAPYATMNATQWEQLGHQLTQSLDSPVAQIKLETLQHINFFATHYSDKVDLTEAVTKLIEIYEDDSEEGFRILALTALNAFDDRSVMLYLSEAVQVEQSPRVRQLTLAALADYNARIAGP